MKAPRTGHVADVVDDIPRGACVIWRGAKTRDGYGKITIGGVHYLTHRLAYMSWWDLSEIPAGFEVMHLCDNPSCWNGAHLKLGTHSENMRQAVERGRFRKPGPRDGRGRFR